MGYTTRFSGAVDLSRPLTLKEVKLCLTLASDYDEASDLWEELLPRPDSYLQWVPDTTLQRIVWDQSEKFYYYTEWLTWLCAVLKTWGIETNGTLSWMGEEMGDVGLITVTNGVVTAEEGSAKRLETYSPMTLDRLAKLALEQATQ